jgi:hypothetical protein
VGRLTKCPAIVAIDAKARTSSDSPASGFAIMRNTIAKPKAMRTDRDRRKTGLDAADRRGDTVPSAGMSEAFLKVRIGDRDMGPLTIAISNNAPYDARIHSFPSAPIRAPR